MNFGGGHLRGNVDGTARRTRTGVYWVLLNVYSVSLAVLYHYIIELCWLRTLNERLVYVVWWIARDALNVMQYEKVQDTLHSTRTADTQTSHINVLYVRSLLHVSASHYYKQ